MRLTITSRTGKFNWCSNEEQVSCHIAVYDDNNEKIKSTNLTLEYEENPDIAYVSDAVYMLEECFKKMWIDTSRQEKEELLQFIKDNENAIDKGSKEYRIIQLNRQIEKLQKEVELLKEI